MSERDATTGRQLPIGSSGSQNTWADVLGRSSMGVGNETLEYIHPTMVQGKPVIHVKTNQFDNVKRRNSKLSTFCGETMEAFH